MIEKRALSWPRNECLMNQTRSHFLTAWVATRQFILGYLIRTLFSSCMILSSHLFISLFVSFYLSQKLSIYTQSNAWCRFLCERIYPYLGRLAKISTIFVSNVGYFYYFFMVLKNQLNELLHLFDVKITE